ncbi:MAG: PHP domain-containing protein [Clostridia bacterium]|nr:PHP domain-containing protein [Clostridia bacterium]
MLTEVIMEKYIDLHTHSLKSDGSMTPAEVVEEAKRAGLAAIALTDHDSVDGVREAVEAGEKLGVEVIPAIEFSVMSKTETHILGYFIDIENPDLKEMLKEVVDLRIERNHVTCQRLNELGFDITLEEVRALAPNNFVGRAHFARVMMDKGYISSVKEGFEKYMSVGKYAYCEKQRLSARDAIELIRNAGGISFLAHPHLTKLPDDELKEFLKKLKNYGLCGLEGYYTDYTPEMQEKYQSMAEELGLMISGGTDFHAKMKPHISIGIGTGNMKIPYSIIEKMKKKCGRS